jgi:peroxiredoxin (alkyl hydroperoxide reductase subunit C)
MRGKADPMECLVTSKAPEFEGTAVHPSYRTSSNPDGFKPVKLADYKGKWLYLFFYPFDFTFVCPTELLAMSEHIEELKKMNVDVLGCSVDSKFSHFNWLRAPLAEGGLEGLQFPLLEDLGGVVAEKFGVKAGTKALRASFLIDPDGVIQSAMVNNTSFGRSVAEHLRIAEAAQFAREHGEVCPMDWKKGDATMKGNFDSKKEFFSKRKAAGKK